MVAVSAGGATRPPMGLFYPRLHSSLLLLLRKTRDADRDLARFSSTPRSNPCPYPPPFQGQYTPILSIMSSGGRLSGKIMQLKFMQRAKEKVSLSRIAA